MHLYIGIALIRVAQAQNPILDAANNFKGLDANKLVGIILNLAGWFLLLVGLIAIVMVLWSAFQFVTAGGGKEEQITQARKTLIYSLIGVAIAMLAFSVVTFTNSLLTSSPGKPASPPPLSDVFECNPADASSCPGQACIGEDRGGYTVFSCQ